MQGDTDIGPMVSARQRAKVDDQVEAAVGAGAECSWAAATAPGRSAATSSPPPWSPARRRRPTCCARRPSGRWRRSCPWSSLDEAIELANSTPLRARARTSTREDLETDLRCMREIKAGTVWFNDPLTDNDAGPVRRLQAVGARPRARPRGPRGLPGDQARPHRDRDRPEGVVVPVLALHRR